MTPLTLDEALAMVQLVDDWGPLMAQMPTKQRNHFKKGLAGKLPHIRWYKPPHPLSPDKAPGHTDQTYAQLLHEASQL